MTSSPPKKTPALPGGPRLRELLLDAQDGHAPTALLRAVRQLFRAALPPRTRLDEVDTLASDFVLACVDPRTPELLERLLAEGDDRLAGAITARLGELQQRRATLAPPLAARFPLVAEQGLPAEARVRAFTHSRRVIHAMRQELSAVQFALVALALGGADDGEANARLGLSDAEADLERAEAVSRLGDVRALFRLG